MQKYILRCADGSVPAPPFDLCVARAERRLFRDATGILRTPQKEQPAHYIISTFHVSELWLLTLFPPALLFHLIQCVAITGPSSQRILASCFLDSLLDMLYFSVMFCYNKLAPIYSPVHSSLLAILQVLKDSDEGHRTRLLENDSILSPVQNSVQKSVHSPVQSPESRFYTNPCALCASISDSHDHARSCIPTRAAVDKAIRTPFVSLPRLQSHFT